MIELILGVGALLYFTRAKKVNATTQTPVPTDVPKYRTSDRLVDNRQQRQDIYGNIYNVTPTPTNPVYTNPTTGASTNATGVNNNGQGRPANAL